MLVPHWDNVSQQKTKNISLFAQDASQARSEKENNKKCGRATVPVVVRNTSDDEAEVNEGGATAGGTDCGDGASHIALVRYRRGRLGTSGDTAQPHLLARAGGPVCSRRS